MASTGANFTAAINALVAERDRVFILKVATDYNLDFAELQGKYLETAEQAIKVPRKYKKREAKLVTVTNEAGETVEVPAKPAKEPKAKAEKQKCTACTSKKEPCKFSSLKGEVFCKRHLKQSLGEEAPAEPKVPKVKKVPEAKLEPVHTHALDEEPAGPCPPCSKYGTPLAPVTSEFEAVARPKAPATGPIKPVPADVDSESEEQEELTPASAAQRLAALLADTDSESDAESDDEDELGAIDEQLYEDD